MMTFLILPSLFWRSSSLQVTWTCQTCVTPTPPRVRASDPPTQASGRGCQQTPSSTEYLRSLKFRIYADVINIVSSAGGHGGPQDQLRGEEISWQSEPGQQHPGGAEVGLIHLINIQNGNHDIAIAMSSSSHADTESALTGGI